jgi:anti-sigma28 factor (negative regulator of flagellin synthesis)
MEIRGIGIDFRSSLPVSGINKLQSATAREAPTNSVKQGETLADSVSLSFIDTVKSSKKENPRVQQIKEQVSNGTYKIPSGSAILDKVPQFTELF